MKKRVSQIHLTYPGILLCLILPGMATSADAGSLYKWVDENGEVRYTDRMPQSASKRQHQTLNDQGIVINTKEAAKSSEELAAIKQAEKERDKRLRAEERDKAAQRKTDQALLLTFSSEAELELAKDERIEVLDSIIQLIYRSMAGTNKKLVELENLADQNYLSKGLEVPGGLAQNIEVLSRKNLLRDNQLRQKLTEKNRIESQFETDLARYRTLSN
jgi:hypothetical protein